MPQMFLNGGGMRGGSLHHLLRGAPLIAETSTAPRYRLHSVGDSYPALQLVAAGGRRHEAHADLVQEPLSQLRHVDLDFGRDALPCGSGGEPG